MDIYLDNAATSWPKPEAVYRAIDQYMRFCGGTPARGHHPRAQEAGALLARCRQRFERLFDAEVGFRLVFTSGATEALNLALKGLLNSDAHVVVTELEHNSVLRPLSALGIRWSTVPAHEDGTIDPTAVRAAITRHTRLIAITHASNVLGTVVDIGAIASVAHERGIPILVDAAQTAGVRPISMTKEGVDLLVFTGHKSLLGAPGTGGLLFREDLPLRPLKEGGTGTFGESAEQPTTFPERYESGSPNMYGIAGLDAALDYLSREGVEKIGTHKGKLLQRLREEMETIEGVQLYGSRDITRTVGILSFNVSDLPPEQVADMLWERRHIMVRAGLHCAPLVHRRIGTAGRGTVRVGIGFQTSVEEIDALITTVCNLRERSSSAIK